MLRDLKIAYVILIQSLALFFENDSCLLIHTTRQACWMSQDNEKAAARCRSTFAQSDKVEMGG